MKIFDYEWHKGLFEEGPESIVNGEDYREIYFELMKVRKQLKEIRTQGIH